jgi:predicted nucleic acid-binding Zn ribbon protein
VIEHARCDTCGDRVRAGLYLCEDCVRVALGRKSRRYRDTAFQAFLLLSLFTVGMLLLFFAFVLS